VQRGRDKAELLFGSLLAELGEMLLEVQAYNAKAGVSPKRKVGLSLSWGSVYILLYNLFTWRSLRADLLPMQFLVSQNTFMAVTCWLSCY
jgi:hypothetical protein